MICLFIDYFKFLQKICLIYINAGQSLKKMDSLFKDFGENLTFQHYFIFFAITFISNWLQSYFIFGQLELDLGLFSQVLWFLLPLLGGFFSLKFVFKGNLIIFIFSSLLKMLNFTKFFLTILLMIIICLHIFI